MKTIIYITPAWTKVPKWVETMTGLGMEAKEYSDKDGHGVEVVLRSKQDYFMFKGVCLA